MGNKSTHACGRGMHIATQCPNDGLDLHTLYLAPAELCHVPLRRTDWSQKQNMRGKQSSRRMLCTLCPITSFLHAFL